MVLEIPIHATRVCTLYGGLLKGLISAPRLSTRQMAAISLNIRLSEAFTTGSINDSQSIKLFVQRGLQELQQVHIHTCTSRSSASFCSFSWLHRPSRAALRFRIVLMRSSRFAISSSAFARACRGFRILSEKRMKRDWYAGIICFSAQSFAAFSRRPHAVLQVSNLVVGFCAHLQSIPEFVMITFGGIGK